LYIAHKNESPQNSVYAAAIVKTSESTSKCTQYGTLTRDVIVTNPGLSSSAHNQEPRYSSSKVKQQHQFQCHIELPTKSHTRQVPSSFHSKTMAIQQRASGLFARAQSLVDSAISPSTRQQYYNNINAFAHESPLLFVRLLSKSPLSLLNPI
jgi:hypothetical protein